MLRINKIKIIFLLVLFYFFILAPITFAQLLIGNSYYDQLHKHLQKAEDSITVAMYFVIIDKEDSFNPVNVLVDDLIAAENRGVDVKVVLEDLKFKASRLAYQKLKDRGIDVYFDTPKELLHVKGVAIDDKYVFIGSANWSRAAIEDNYEVTYLEESREDAIAFREYVESIPVAEGEFFLPAEDGVELLSSFLLSSDLGRQLLKAQAYKQLDLYLLLCKMQEKGGKAYFDIDYDSLAKKMGYKAPEDLRKYRNVHHYYYERIHRLLIPLKKHGLIDYKQGKVTLKANISEKPDKSTIIISYEYWQEGYSDKLSMRAKYMYLICLYEASRSTKYPLWFRSQKDMSKLYGISDTTISLGLQELEDKGLIEIIRDKPTPPDFSDRKANVYKMLPLKRK
jgi:HKD family nuclease